ncbi:hypothetical protein K469DRAFT_792094, partial [Zopfia rhizophila CBS 207.26]
ILQGPIFVFKIELKFLFLYLSVRPGFLVGLIFLKPNRLRSLHKVIPEIVFPSPFSS